MQEQDICVECGQALGIDELGLDPLPKLAKDLRDGAASLDRFEAAPFVQMYYEYQEHRIALDNQVRTLTATGRPAALLGHFGDQLRKLESQVAATLGEWSLSTEVGRWSRAQKGIGPVLAAGLMAYIDIERAPTVGRIWRYAGLDPTLEWLGTKKATELVAEYVPAGQKPTMEVIATIAERLNRKPESIIALAQVSRDDEAVDEGELTPNITRAKLISALSRRPYNARLKTHMWKIGDSFVKVSGREGAFYGKMYRDRKAIEVVKNETRAFADQAAHALATRNIKDKKLRATYEDGKLPPGRIDLRARRWAVKLFLAHWHEVAFKERYGVDPPLPYPIAHLGHVDKIEVP
jgi:hypothetical protein